MTPDPLVAALSKTGLHEIEQTYEEAAARLRDAGVTLDATRPSGEPNWDPEKAGYCPCGGQCHHRLNPCSLSCIDANQRATRPSGDDFPDPALDRVNDEDCYPSGDEALRAALTEFDAAYDAITEPSASSIMSPEHYIRWDKAIRAIRQRAALATPSSTPDVEDKP